MTLDYKCKTLGMKDYFKTLHASSGSKAVVSDLEREH